MLKYYYGVMGSGKSAKIIEYYTKHKATVCLKLKFEEEFFDVIHSRNGKSVPCINFMKSSDLIKLYFETPSINKAKTLIIDEVQFCSVNQIKQLEEISHSMDVICFGLLRTNDGTLFSSTKLLLELSDYTEELRRKCVCCNKNNATVSRRYVSTDFGKYQQSNITYTKPVLSSKNRKYLSMCNDCARKYKEFSKKEINTILKEVL